MASDDTCPVCHTTELVGASGPLLLVRDLAAGRSRFCELERSLAGISPRTLSLRLRALEEDGIVERHTYPEVPPRVEYSLTQKGLDLLPIIDSIARVRTALALRGDLAGPRASHGRRCVARHALQVRLRRQDDHPRGRIAPHAVAPDPRLVARLRRRGRRGARR